MLSSFADTWPQQIPALHEKITKMNEADLPVCFVFAAVLRYTVFFPSLTSRTITGASATLKISSKTTKSTNSKLMQKMKIFRLQLLKLNFPEQKKTNENFNKQKSSFSNGKRGFFYFFPSVLHYIYVIIITVYSQRISFF